MTGPEYGSTTARRDASTVRHQVDPKCRNALHRLCTTSINHVNKSLQQGRIIPGPNGHACDISTCSTDPVSVLDTFKKIHWQQLV